MLPPWMADLSTALGGRAAARPSGTGPETWLSPVSLGAIALGLLLLVAGIVFLVLAFRSGPRRGGGVARPPAGAASAADERVSGTMPVPELTALPVGSTIGGGGYTLLEVLATSPHENLYRAVESPAGRRCPACGRALPDPAPERCPSCGAGLASAGSPGPLFLVRERAGEAAFRAEEHLLLAPLYHPALHLPLAVFGEVADGIPRRYAVEKEPLPLPAGSPAPPQEVRRVLQWGLHLAQALARLHRHGVTLDRHDLGQIAIQGEQACWGDLGAAQVFPQGAGEEFQEQVRSDLHGLVASLWKLLGGEEASRPLRGLSAETAAFFEAALAGRLPAGSAEELVSCLGLLLATQGRPLPLLLVMGQRSDIGRRRTLNEDCLLAMQTLLGSEGKGLSLALLAVADGMGGHQAGEVSSRLAISTVAARAHSELFAPAAARQPLPLPRAWVESAIRAANSTVFEQRQAAGSDMGTTLTLALLVDRRIFIGHVGDSRAYLLTPRQITRLTVDHSLVQRLVEAGQITPEQARTHPNRNVVYRSIGERPDVEVDLSEQQLQPGEALLLCSDGLNSMLTDTQIWEVWKDAPSPQEACDRLVAAANDAGGEDNITVVLAQAVG